MKKLLYPAIIVLVVLVSSCSQYRILTERQTTSLRPNLVQLHIDLEDFEYLGKSEISVVSRKYVGLFSRIDTVNNERYNYRDIKVVTLTGFTDIKLKAEMRKAAYKVIDDYPEANYYIIGQDYKKVHRMFLGSKTWRSMDIHAYKFKK
ncbi:MAG: hypothetical protein OCD76_02565 [Reichenbachiella sp.]